MSELAIEYISLRFEMQEINLDVIRPVILERGKGADALR
jgi:hypothetical protein